MTKMSGFDAKRFKVVNPEALGEKEKQLWVRLEPIVQDLLDELKDAGKIESVFPPAKMALLQATFDKLDEFSAVHNVVLHLSESEPKFKEFLPPTPSLDLQNRTLSPLTSLRPLQYQCCQ